MPLLSKLKPRVRVIVVKGFKTHYGRTILPEQRGRVGKFPPHRNPFTKEYEVWIWYKKRGGQRSGAWTPRKNVRILDATV